MATKRILIVDDEKDIAELIDDVLIDEGFETVIKNNGEEAFEEIKNNKILGDYDGKLDNIYIYICNTYRIFQLFKKESN